MGIATFHARQSREQVGVGVLYLPVTPGASDAPRDSAGQDKEHETSRRSTVRSWKRDPPDCTHGLNSESTAKPSSHAPSTVLS